MAENSERKETFSSKQLFIKESTSNKHININTHKNLRVYDAKFVLTSNDWSRQGLKDKGQNCLTGY